MAINNLTYSERLAVILEDVRTGVYVADPDGLAAELMSLVQDWTLGGLSSIQVAAQFASTVANWDLFVEGLFAWVNTPADETGGSIVVLVDYLGNEYPVPSLQKIIEDAGVSAEIIEAADELFAARDDAAASAAAAVVSKNAAAASATAAAGSATAASGSATTAGGSATTATTAKNLAQTAQAAAEAARDAALASFANFSDKYLGAFAADPTTDLDGSALEGGDLYYKTGTSPGMRVYTGSAWNAAYVDPTGLQPLDPDLTAIAAITTAAYGRSVLATGDAPALRTLAGLGTIATQAASAVALTGGAINGTTIGATTPSTGAFTTVSIPGATNELLMSYAGNATGARTWSGSGAGWNGGSNYGNDGLAKSATGAIVAFGANAFVFRTFAGATVGVAPTLVDRLSWTDDLWTFSGGAAFGGAAVNSTALSAQGSGAKWAVSAYNPGNSFGAFYGRVDNTACDLATFYYGASTKVGSITTTGTATAYNTSSDYRLKANVEATDIAASLDIILSVPLRDFDWISNGARDRGALAHELALVKPEAVHGAKDAVDVDGGILAQGVDWSKFVPDLIGSVQAMNGRLAALELAA